MNIVIFGADNSGKTTLAKQIAEQYNLEYVRSIGPNKTAIEYGDFLFQKLNEEGDHVFDRFSIIEEDVNGKVLRNVSNIDKNYIDRSLFFDKVDLFIYANPSIKDITNWGDREQMEGIKSHITDLIRSYSKYYRKLKTSGYNVVTYDWRSEEDIILITKYIALSISTKEGENERIN